MIYLKCFYMQSWVTLHVWVDPVSVHWYSSPYSWVVGLSTTSSPWGDTNEDIANDKWATRVSLAGILTSDSQSSSADHVVGDWVEWRVSVDALLLVDNWDGYFVQLSGRASSFLWFNTMFRKSTKRNIVSMKKNIHTVRVPHPVTKAADPSATVCPWLGRVMTATPDPKVNWLAKKRRETSLSNLLLNPECWVNLDTWMTCPPELWYEDPARILHLAAVVLKYIQ